MGPANSIITTLALMAILTIGSANACLTGADELANGGSCDSDEDSRSCYSDC